MLPGSLRGFCCSMFIRHSFLWEIPVLLALGGFVAAMAVELKMPLYIAIVGIIYLAEVLSVILQVVYFKLSGGKRLFRMAPLHHHFEQCGWRETTVVALFSIVTTVMCIAAILD